MLRQTWRWLMIGCGLLALAFGIVGIFLPLLPTTPFVLLAAFFFSRGSERLHRWLADHPRFGGYVRDWEAEQVVPPIGKYASTLVMVPSVSWALVSRDIPLVLEAGMVVTVVAVLWFIWSRPSYRSSPNSSRPEIELARADPGSNTWPKPPSETQKDTGRG